MIDSEFSATAGSRTDSIKSFNPPDQAQISGAPIYCRNLILM